MLCATCSNHSEGFCGRYGHPARPDMAISAAFALTERCFGRSYMPTDYAVFLAAVQEKGQSLTERAK